MGTVCSDKKNVSPNSSPKVEKTESNSLIDLNDILSPDKVRRHKRYVCQYCFTLMDPNDDLI